VAAKVDIFFKSPRNCNKKIFFFFSILPVLLLILLVKGFLVPCPFEKPI
jgi:hypothetical protein